MPTYEYRCQECGSELEVVQSIHDDALTECPTCGGKLRKLFGNVGIVFKGSGFYRTDNRSKPGGSRPAKPSGKNGTSGKPASGTDSTAAAKPSAETSAPAATAKPSAPPPSK